jgi:hypothetical protein
MPPAARVWVSTIGQSITQPSPSHRLPAYLPCRWQINSRPISQPISTSSDDWVMSCSSSLAVRQHGLCVACRGFGGSGKWHPPSTGDAPCVALVLDIRVEYGSIGALPHRLFAAHGRWVARVLWNRLDA